MARQRDPRRDEAFQIWKASDGKKLLKDIAEELGVADTQIRKWKSQDKWESPKGNVTNSKSNVTKPKERKEVEIQSDDLNDRQQLFCLYYLKYFNATKAYQKVYESNYTTAMASGSRMLRNVKVDQEIDRLKEEQAIGLKLDGRQILQKYIDIAFADMTDFITFNEIESTAEEIEKTYDDAGRVTGEVIRQVPYTYTAFRMKKSEEVDGSLLTELSKGKDGMFKVKLADKMKALDFLAKYTDLLSENDRKKLQEEKLKADIAKANAEIDKLTDNTDDDPIEIVISRKGGH